MAENKKKAKRPSQAKSKSAVRKKAKAAPRRNAGAARRAAIKTPGKGRKLAARATTRKPAGKSAAKKSSSPRTRRTS